MDYHQKMASSTIMNRWEHLRLRYICFISLHVYTVLKWRDIKEGASRDQEVWGKNRDRPRRPVEGHTLTLTHGAREREGAEGRGVGGRWTGDGQQRLYSQR